MDKIEYTDLHVDMYESVDISHEWSVVVVVNVVVIVVVFSSLFFP